MQSILTAVVAIVAAVIASAGCTTMENNAIVEIKTSEGKKISFEAETATTPEQWRTGLMNREILAEAAGMLFTYPDSRERSFWMKNTIIPLDIIFIDENMTIIKIHSAEPCEKEPCERYKSGDAARHALEINGGLAEKKGIREGNKVKIAR